LYLLFAEYSKSQKFISIEHCYIKQKGSIKLEITLSRLVTTPDVDCFGKASLSHTSVNLVDCNIFLWMASLIDWPFCNSKIVFRLWIPVGAIHATGIDLSDLLTFLLGVPFPCKYNIKTLIMSHLTNKIDVQHQLQSHQVGGLCSPKRRMCNRLWLRSWLWHRLWTFDRLWWRLFLRSELITFDSVWSLWIRGWLCMFGRLWRSLWLKGLFCLSHNLWRSL